MDQISLIGCACPPASTSFYVVQTRGERTEPEIDFVLTIGERRIPLEVKYRRRIDSHRDTLGLRAFVEKTHYNAPFGVLVTMSEDVDVPDPRIVPVSLRSLLLGR